MSFEIHGHRGARGLLPENTIDACLHALSLGVDAVEIDVVVSADRQLVVSHEPWMSSEICARPDGSPVSKDEERELNLYSTPYSEIRRYDCGSRGHPRFAEQRPRQAFKPLLRDLIRSAETYRTEQVSGAFTYSIEAKSRPEWDGRFGPAPPTFVDLLHHLLTEENVIARSTLQSFDERLLREADNVSDDWKIALLVDEHEGADPEEWADRLGFVPAIFSPNFHLLTDELRQRAHGLGMRVIPWTVNRRKDMERMMALGADGLISDYPDCALALARDAR
ncbi:MAG: glycerophosphodiester phosphodiesterase family protein [Bacteroidota bacterium]